MTYEFRGFHIPDRMMPAITRYIETGEIPGDFLQAIICNDLKQAVSRADEENLANLPAYIGYFWNRAPMTCWGSNQAMIAWAQSFKPKPPTNYSLDEAERFDDPSIGPWEHNG